MDCKCPTCERTYKKVHSKSSQIFFWKLYSLLNRDIQNCVYFDELNKELKFPINDTNYSLDFCILKDNKKFCLEYFGSYWHASPDIYNWDTIIIENVMACDIWQHDYERKTYLENCGFKCEIVWEHDNIEDKLNELHSCITQYFSGKMNDNK